MVLRRTSVILGLAFVVAGCFQSSGKSNINLGLVEPCSWLRIQDVRRIIGPNVGVGAPNPHFPQCSFDYTSATGIRTDLVVGYGEVTAQSIRSFTLPNHRNQVVENLGDHAVFLEAASLDDGNNIILVVASHNRSLLIGGEFLNLDQAKQLAALVIAKWT